MIVSQRIYHLTYPWIVVFTQQNPPRQNTAHHNQPQPCLLSGHVGGFSSSHCHHPSPRIYRDQIFGLLQLLVCTRVPKNLCGKAFGWRTKLIRKHNAENKRKNFIVIKQLFFLRIVNFNTINESYLDYIWQPQNLACPFSNPLPVWIWQQTFSSLL